MRLDQGSKSLAPLVGRFRKLWPDRKTLTRAPKVGADGQPHVIFGNGDPARSVS